MSIFVKLNNIFNFLVNLANKVVILSGPYQMIIQTIKYKISIIH